ncbi:PREDICTED: monofunctional riboflavin biosynthesis protein RIBA 3, chloroplastic-like isoform X2 [Ipomoea nil]|uniref:monofunctional riboflavin biosynthesis protein RIBA 3, chloroplastic-like isoform X2 n=1 Tax=Ipomoea nil TaxID=35883 RepID=UPI000900FD61|nr:PREDICTED: monofunctional riboflavin biosynthesis protein RIBA 3, chloroplastic-like isoform X2 [Ipomoea nil]
MNKVAILMDCVIGFKHPLLPRSIFFTSRSCLQSLVTFQNAQNKKCRASRSACWAAGNSFDDQMPLESSENGSLPVFETLSAEITPETTDFFVSDAEGDPDCPSEGFSSVGEALTSLRQGKDAKIGTTTGVSAADRAKTVLALSSSSSRADDFRRPGHVFPLKYRNGGVLRRPGHTEASVDLVMLAGRQPVSVLSAIIDGDDGSMAKMPSLRKLSFDYGIPIISITDLIRYRRKREKLVERTAISRLPTKWGLFQAHCYRSKLDTTEHIAIVKGDIGNGQDVLVRVHSECLTGDIFGSRRCDCGNQLDLAMQLIEEAGRGVVVYLRGHEGRGIGLGHKLQAYNLQDLGHDTVEANLELGFAADAREYGIGAQILRDLGVRTMCLMTNNPDKFTGLKGFGLAVVGRVPVLTPYTEENRRYLETKRTKMGHVYGSDIQTPQFIKPNEKKQDPPHQTQEY